MVTEYTFHEAANLFPMMDAEAFKGLCADIKENGLREPIWLHDGQIIDGRNRYEACKEAGVDPRFREWDRKGSLVSFVVSLNLNRRHLTASQRTIVGLDMMPFLEAEAKERQRESGGDRKSEEYHGSVEALVPQPIEREPQARKVAADMVGVSERYLQDAKTVAREKPELVEQIRKGEVTVKEAMREIKPAPEKTPTPAPTPPAETVIGTQAMQFARIAVSQLERVRKDDPMREEAFNHVTNWIHQQGETK